MKRLEGKRTLVTGAASELGSAVVRAFVENRAAVLAVDSTDDKVEAAITALGLRDSNDVITRGLDESDLGSWWDLANLIAAFYFELDVFVHVPQLDSADSLTMAIDRLKQPLLNADTANPGAVYIVIISTGAEQSAKEAVLELAESGSKIRLESVNPGPPKEVAETIVQLVSAVRSTS